MTSPQAAGVEATDPEASNREKMLDTAEALFSRLGYSGVDPAEVAERVGVSKSSLSRHFPSAAGLYLAVLERVLASIEDRVRGALHAKGTPLFRLERWIDSLIDALAERPHFAPLLLRALFEEVPAAAEQRAPLDERLDGILDGVRTLLESGKANGSLRSVSIPHTVQTLIGMTLFPFASGAFGERMLGEPLHSAAAVRRRKREVQALLRCGLRPTHV